MKFHEYTTALDRCSAQVKGLHLSIDEFYRIAAGKLIEDHALGSALTVAAEAAWYESGRPYYKAWPAICGALVKIKFDIPSESVPMPAVPCFLIRFAAEKKLFIREVRSILVWCRDAVVSGKKGLSLSIAAQYENGEMQAGGTILKHGQTVENSIGTKGCGYDDLGNPVSIIDKELTERLTDGNDEWASILKLIMSICIMSNDPSIITPDVLSADRDRYESETDEAWKQRAVDRARRRGIVGWNIGADYEVCPHYRRPHFGLRYTGKGGTVPRIVPIKGAVVHRSKLTEVPTGYMLPDGTEVEK